MDPGVSHGIQGRLQGILSKLNTEQLKSKVTDWQKRLLASASSTFSFDQPSVNQRERSGSWEQCNWTEENNDVEVSPLARDFQMAAKLSGEAMEGSSLMEAALLHPMDEPPRNKSPIQQWVDSLTDERDRRDEEVAAILETGQTDAEIESLSLGAEAPGVTCPRAYPFVQISTNCDESDADSHCSSMESLLESRKLDPEEMLLELGFGGSEEPDIISRIPERFLRPSAMKGVVIDDFIKYQQMMVHQFQSGFSGYRGLTGPSHAMPSGIVGKIMDRLLEAEVERQSQGAYCRSQQNRVLLRGVVQHCQASQNQGRYSPRLARLAHNIMLKIKGTKKEMSVLSPENRNWYESQGDKSPEPAGRRIIIGHHSYTFSKDGNLVEDTKENINVLPNTDCGILSSAIGNANYLEEQQKPMVATRMPTENAYSLKLNSFDKYNSKNSQKLLLADADEGILFPPPAEVSYLPGIDTDSGSSSFIPDILSTNIVHPYVPTISHSSVEMTNINLNVCGLQDDEQPKLLNPILSPNGNNNLCLTDSCDENTNQTTFISGNEQFYPSPGAWEFLPINDSCENNRDSNARFSTKSDLPEKNNINISVIHKKREQTELSNDPSGSRQTVSIDSLESEGATHELNKHLSLLEEIHKLSRVEQDHVGMEYKKLSLLMSQLQGATISATSEEEFLALSLEERKVVQLAVIGEALKTYKNRLMELDLRGQLKDILLGQMQRVADLLDTTSQTSLLAIIKQMTSLLQHQKALKQELDLHVGRSDIAGKSSFL